MENSINKDSISLKMYAILCNVMISPIFSLHSTQEMNYPLTQRIHTVYITHTIAFAVNRYIGWRTIESVAITVNR